MSTKSQQEKTKPVRVNLTMHKELKILAAHSGKSMTKLLHEMFVNMSENVNTSIDEEATSLQANADLLFAGNPKKSDIF